MTPKHSLWQGDCVEWLRGLPDESVDLVITDPAYESLEKHRIYTSKDGQRRHRGRIPRLKEWFDIFPNTRFTPLFCELYRVMKRNTHFYMFCDSETMFVAKPMAEAAGFRFWKPIVWDKERMGMGYHYRNSCEFILFFEKGKRKLNDLGIRDVIRCNGIRNGYPTEKPVEVSDVLVKQSSTPGELVIDTFVGSGSVGVAALRNDREFMGCDVSSTAIAVTMERFARLQLGLFDSVSEATL